MRLSGSRTTVDIELLQRHEPSDDVKECSDPAVHGILEDIILRMSQLIKLLKFFVRTNLMISNVSCVIEICWSGIMFIQWQILDQCHTLREVENSHERLKNIVKEKISIFNILQRFSVMIFTN